MLHNVQQSSTQAEILSEMLHKMQHSPLLRTRQRTTLLPPFSSQQAVQLTGYKELFVRFRSSLVY